MEAWVALVVTAAGTIGGATAGAIIALKGARALSRDEREAAERRETVRAYRLFVGEAVKSVAELRQLPATPVPNAIEEAIGGVVDRIRGDANTRMAVKQRVHRLYGDRHLELADQLVAAAVDLRLRELPEAARAAVDETTDYVARLGEQRSDELIAEWKDVHGRLFAAGDDLRRWAAPRTPSRTFPANDDGQHAAEAAGAD